MQTSEMSQTALFGFSFVFFPRCLTDEGNCFPFELDRTCMSLCMHVDVHASVHMMKLEAELSEQSFVYIMRSEYWTVLARLRCQPASRRGASSNGTDNVEADKHRQRFFFFSFFFFFFFLSS